MKKSLGLAIATIGFFAVAGTAEAQIITSIQFGDSNAKPVGANSAGEGIYSVSHWNDVVTGPASASTNTLPTLTSLNLVTSATSTSSLTGTIYAAGNYETSAPPAGGTFKTGDFNLATGFALAGYGGTTKVTLTLNNLNPNDTYELVAYDYDAGTSMVTAVATDGSTGGTEYFGKQTSALNNYVLGYSTTAAYSAGGASNYLDYTGLTGSSTLTLNLQEAGSNFYGLEGVQLVDTTVAATTVPEPSTYVMLGAGVLGLVLLRQRRRLM
jgi:hypothetical protein